MSRDRPPKERPKLNILKLSKMPIRLVMEKNFLRLSPDDKIEELIKNSSIKPAPSSPMTMESSADSFRSTR